MSTGTKVANFLHKAIVVTCIGASVTALADVYMMHRGIIAQGKEELAKRELEQLREIREAQQAQDKLQTFPQGTDLHPSSPSAASRMV